MSGRKGKVPSRKAGSPRFAPRVREEAPVITYQLSPEELAAVRGNKHIPTLEEYQTLRKQGKTREQIMELWGWNHNQLASFETRHQLGNRYQWPKSAKERFGREILF